MAYSTNEGPRTWRVPQSELDVALKDAHKSARKLGRNCPEPEELEVSALQALAWAYREWNPARGASFRTFCYLVVTRACHQEKSRQIRRSKHEVASIDNLACDEDGNQVRWADLLRDPGPSLLGTFLSDAQKLAALDAIQLLSPTHQAVIYLRYFEGLDYKQIGKRIGKSHETARQYEMKALQELRKHLAEWLE